MRHLAAPRLRVAAPALFALLALALDVAIATASGQAPKNFGRDRSVDIVHARIQLALDIPSETIRGATELTVRGIAGSTAEAVFDAVRFDVTSVTAGDAPAAHDNDGQTLRVTLAPPLAEGEDRVIRISYSARPRNGLYFVHGPGARRDLDQCWSQGETMENRHWFPVHDDPSERMTSETVITVPEPLAVVSNGPLLSVTPAGPGLRTFHHRMDFPHVPYLVSIAVGDWATRSETWEGKELTYHVPRDREADMDRSFANTARILSFLSKETGVPYPYPVYRQTCVSDYTFGGMENIAATTLTDRTLHDERAHSDWTSDSLVAHEAAHQWFGDYVTCRDWSDIWLNEGFATYYAALSMGELLGPDQLVVELDGMRQNAIDADRGDKRRPVVTNRWHDEMELFDGHAYAKGGMILHALRRELGDDGYRRSVTAWLKRFAGSSANTHDFISVIEEQTGRDVSRFFDQWIFGSGQPDLAVSWTWKDGSCAVTIVQGQAADDPDRLFNVPLDLQVLGEGLATDRSVRLSRREETFHVPCETRPEAVVVDPQGWLLRTIKMDRPDREAAWVLRHAPHLLARLEAARELKESAGLAGAHEALVDAARSAPAWALRRAACESLERSGPGGAAVLIGVLESDADTRVRTAAAAALASHRTPAAQAALTRALAGAPSYAVRGAAARSLGRFDDPALDRVLEAAASQRSHREEVLGGCLDALAQRHSPRLLALAQRLASARQPYEVRARAIGALGRLAKNAVDAGERRRVVADLIEWLDEPHYRVRLAASEALVTAADEAGLPALRRIAASHPHELTRARVAQHAKQLEAAVVASASVAEVRRSLEEERRKREALEERVRKLEARLPPADESK